MSIYNKIYTLNKTQWKEDNYNTVILKMLSIPFRVYISFYYLKIYPEKFNFLILFLNLAKLARSFW